MSRKTTLSRVTFTTEPPASVHWGRVITPQGPMILGMTEEGAVCRLAFMNKKKVAVVLAAWKREWPKTVFVHDARLVSRFDNKLFSGRKETPKIVLAGTPFQRRVWKALLDVPAGRVVSYTDLARRIRKPKAARAVGNALGANPVPVLVPCHRVIASNGSLGGYGGGLANKRKLLKAENVSLSGR